MSEKRKHEKTKARPPPSLCSTWHQCIHILVNSRISEKSQISTIGGDSIRRPCGGPIQHYSVKVLVKAENQIQRNFMEKPRFGKPLLSPPCGGTNADVEVWVDMCHSVSVFSRVNWGHFWVILVTTHRVTCGSDDINPGINDWRLHKVKI